MGLVVLAILLVANSPVLDFRKLSLNSQLGRVESGEIELGDFDFYYTKHHLGRPGYLEMERIKAEIGDSDPDLLATINDPPRLNRLAPIDSAAFWDDIVFRPEPFDPPPGLKTMIENRVGSGNVQHSVLIRADLNDDGVDEYFYLAVHDWGVGHSLFFYRKDDAWQASYVTHYVTPSELNVDERILEGELQIVDPEYRHLDIGGVILRPLPEN